MDPTKVLRGLRTQVFGRPLYCYASTGSTNDVALELARAGAAEGTVVQADVQTRGRGRRGRSWVLTQGKGLAFSLVLRPSPQAAPWITLASAVAVARTLEDYRLKPGIKWPNDILLSGKKACGILTEVGSGPHNGVPIVLGIGINLGQRAGDFPSDLRPLATSLRMVLGKAPDPVRFFQRLLASLEEAQGWVRAGRTKKVLEEGRVRSAVLGRQVRVQQGSHVLHGQALDLDEQGALLVRNDQGMVEKVMSGDVTLLRIEEKG